MSDYLEDLLADIGTGAGDVARAGIADVQDSYQEILMGGASISPPDGLPVEYVTETTTHEPDVGGVALESYGPDTTDAIPGLDMG